MVLKFAMRLGALLVLALCVCPRADLARASSVARVDLERMLERSELVFEGIVEEHEVAIDATTGFPRTRVRFSVLDVIKGDVPASPFWLSFAGGAVGEIHYAVSDLVIPPVGEHGIYFVESTAQAMVNPLYGWSQGHFHVEDRDPPSDDGPAGSRARATPRVRREIVLTQGGRPVIDVHPRDPAPVDALSEGIAGGVVEGDPQDPSAGLSTSAFKERLREMLRARQP